METVLYRHFDHGGRLLYVGISLDVLRRTQQHRQTAHWFRDVAKFTAERFPSRAAAIAAERQAIADENPAFNKQRPKFVPSKAAAPPAASLITPAPRARAIAFPGLPQWRSDRAKEAAGFRVLRLPQIAGPAGCTGLAPDQWLAMADDGSAPRGFMLLATVRAWLMDEVVGWIAFRADHPSLPWPAPAYPGNVPPPRPKGATMKASRERARWLSMMVQPAGIFGGAEGSP